MKSFEVRSAFINYFKEQGHIRVPSSSLVPDEEDRTLLFTNAGMNQFKKFFLGLEKPPHKRVVNSQKCVRAGGKHNDLENVGFTARHHTFFEMLGNFSFKDYFKKEAIHFSWDFLTNELKIPMDRLHVTVFKDDDEAANIWHQQERVPISKILRCGPEDNFWRMGETGPCGPCSEIFYDHGPKTSPSEDRYVEIWNLVFMQFDEKSSGQMEPLPHPSIDTGAGLERLTAVLQNTPINYETDIFQTLIERIQELTDLPYRASKDVMAAYRVLADHARATAFLIGDGVLPLNEGRGYVLRRIMRRGLRFGKKLSSKSLLPSIVECVIEDMGDEYTSLKQNKELIQQTTKDEESRFFKTLDQGTQLLDTALKTLKAGNTLDSTLVFKLYDTYGFPMDLTRVICREHGIHVNESAFQSEMEKTRKRSQASWKKQDFSKNKTFLLQWTQDQNPTLFVGYDSLSAEANVLKISKEKTNVDVLKEGESGFIIFDKTPFYAEGGGQVGDQGKGSNPSISIDIKDCTRVQDCYLHDIVVTQGEIHVGQTLSLHVKPSHRQEVAYNHSATHLLHAALRNVLGRHVTQAGSLVEPTHLRFDFTHNKPVTDNEIFQIEAQVNEQIFNNLPVTIAHCSYNEAVKKGALTLAGEKYKNSVRVLKMGDYSLELCGGTHVQNTGAIRVFKIVRETGVSSGVRRIEALTGQEAVAYLMNNTRENLINRKYFGLTETWGKTILEKNIPTSFSYNTIHTKTPIIQKIKDLEQDIKNLKKQLIQWNKKEIDIKEILNTAKNIDGGKLITAHIDLEDKAVLGQVADSLRDKIQSGIIVIVGKGKTSHPIIVSVSQNLTQKYHAGTLLKKVASQLDGQGGGRSHFAQGAGKNLKSLPIAFKSLYDSLSQ